VTVWGVTKTAAVAALVAVLAGCSDGDGAAAPTTTGAPTPTTEATTTTTAPERMASTTTTAFDPATVEGEVEAAYLRSWDVYADAVYHLELDEQALAEVYAGEHLETKRSEIEGRIADGRAALVVVEHDYEIQFLDASTAAVIDQYRNHQVLIDPDTKAPIEDDPNEVITDLVTVKFVADSWKVSRKERIDG
jgi:hypothetical protein